MQGTPLNPKLCKSSLLRPPLCHRVLLKVCVTVPDAVKPQLLPSHCLRRSDAVPSTISCSCPWLPHPHKGCRTGCCCTSGLPKGDTNHDAAGGQAVTRVGIIFFFFWFSRGPKQSLPWPRRVTASGPPASKQVLPLGSHPGQHTQLLDEPCKRPLKHHVTAGACESGALQGPGKS